MRTFRIISLILLTLALCFNTSCENSGGDTGNNDTTGKPAAAKKAYFEPGDPDCPYGGIAVSTGIDTNGNGILDDSEVTNTEKICNGAPGENGLDGANGSDGTNGTDGADGSDGTNGLNALVNVTPEDAGNNCSAGGVRVDTGTDLNSDGDLDADEISNTSYICNGTDGEPAAGPEGTLNVSGMIASGNYLSLPHNLNRMDLTFTGQFVKNGYMYDYSDYSTVFGGKYLSMNMSATFGSNSIQYSQIATLTSGNFVIIYQDKNDSQGKFIIANSSGVTVHGPTVFNASNGSADSAITALQNGNFVIAYRDHNQSDYGKFTIYNPSGAVVKTVTFYTAGVNKIAACTMTQGHYALAFLNSAKTQLLFAAYSATGEVVTASKVLITWDTAFLNIMISPLYDNNCVLGIGFPDNKTSFFKINTGGNFFYVTTNSGDISYLQIGLPSVNRFSVCTQYYGLEQGNFIVAYRDVSNVNCGRFMVFNQDYQSVAGPFIFEKNAGGPIEDMCVMPFGNGGFAITYQYTNNSTNFCKLTVFDADFNKVAEKVYSNYSFDKSCRTMTTGTNGRIALITRNGGGYLQEYSVRKKELKLQRVNSNEVRLYNNTTELLELILSVNQ